MDIYWGPPPGMAEKAMYPRTQRLRGSGGKAKSKGCLGSWWMHVVVSSSCVVFQQRITSFAIVRFGFVVVPRVSVHVFFLRAPGSICIRCTSFLF